MKSNIKSDISLSNQSRLSIPISDYSRLKQEIQKVKYPIYAISQAQSLQNKINSFKSQKIIPKLQQKLKQLNSYRKVRGDGNCFFRALAFSYLCNISNPTYNNCFQMIKQINLACCYPESIPKDFQKFYDNKLLVNILQSFWEQTYNKCLIQSGNITKKALLKLFDENPFLDFIIVLYFRSVCLKALYKFHPMFQNFLGGDEEKIIRTYSQQSQGIILHLCSKIFQISINVIQVRKEQVRSYHYDECKTRKTLAIYLLFYESHYDIVEYNDNIQAQKSVLKKKSTYYDQVNEKMRKGTCIQCGDNNWIYEQSNLCVKCHQYSLTSLSNYQKQQFIKGKCNQCGNFSSVSRSFGLCKECIQIQNRIQLQRVNQSFRRKCSLCGKYAKVDEQTGICNNCLNNQKSMMNHMEMSKKFENMQIKHEDNRNQQNPSLDSHIKGHEGYICKKCQKMSIKGLNYGLCKDCARQN